ncbi:MAG: hypothetical protein A3I72_09905 [Candidatus Tectomicrobia bacterium RIFCSPLOWO2_02_FULL_70_19]|nr:MAG: hypothetical protein A3I72_09905 [Candidatus Tectomicrobia bacterium RIFCSPLOWO2_02_FULL_70_19]
MWPSGARLRRRRAKFPGSGSTAARRASGNARRNQIDAAPMFAPQSRMDLTPWRPARGYSSRVKTFRMA